MPCPYRRFCTATADVNREGLLISEIDAARHAEIDQSCFLAAGDHADVEAGLPAQHLQKYVTIQRFSCGCRRDGDNLLRGGGASHLCEMASGGNRPLHRRRVQLALREFAFAEADRLLEAVQDCVGVLRFESDNEEPHGICAEVHKRDGVRPDTWSRVPGLWVHL